MSSKQELILYEKFYLSIKDIFVRKGIEKKLSPFNIDQDKIIIGAVFRVISKNENDDFANWTEAEWIESMEVPEIYMLSFLYKKQLTIKKIYNMTTNVDLKASLYSNYKNLVTMVKFLESLEKASNLFIDTSIDIDKMKNKQLQIALNIRNYKDPKNLSNLIDLLYHKQFRDNLLQNILNGIDKVDLSVLKSLSDINIPYSELIDTYCTQDNTAKIFLFLMKFEIKGNVYVNKNLYNVVRNYINEVIQNSDQIQRLFSHLEDLSKESSIPFKNKINVVIVDNTQDFVQECNACTNKLVFEKDIITSFESFHNGEYVRFKSIDLIKRIREIIFIAVQKIMQFSSLAKEDKVSILNEYIKKYIISNLNDDEDFIFIDKENIQIPNIPTFLKDEFSLKIRSLIKELVESLNNDEEIKELINIKNEFIEIMKYVTQLDYSTIDKSEFNIVLNLVNKIFKKPNQLKFLIIKFLNAEIIKKYISNFEKDSSIKVNPELKEKLTSKMVTGLKELIDILVNSQDLGDLEKFVVLIAKAVDYVLYYTLKLKSSDIKPKVVKQKMVIANRR